MINKNSNRNYRFFAEIVELSYAKDWEEAKKEWSVEEIYKVPHEEALTCICGHHPILNIIKRKINDEKVIWLIETILKNGSSQNGGGEAFLHEKKVCPLAI